MVQLLRSKIFQINKISKEYLKHQKQTLYQYWFKVKQNSESPNFCYGIVTIPTVKSFKEYL